MEKFLNGIEGDYDKELIENLQADKAHTRIMKHFKNYCIVGGMPETVMRYTENRYILASGDI
ncbi:MAG: hypothetical protein KH897_05100 [Bacteroides sp.]|jgi:predicted AAA+ superfamily ATPase|uniref:hypothetical protein n=1 Tax=Bacteroides TaxID=816 RepID=UPI0025C645BB|nr:hypothetical protein [Bacteroides sp.]MBS6237761.1 hypothetical protein [Bacteroides sp.]